MPIRILTSLALIAALASVSAAAEPPASDMQRFQIVMGSHLPRATKVETVHAASCQTVDYRLVVSPEKKTVILTANGRADTDLSATELGARLLDEDVLAHVGFNCPMNALNIFIKGVRLVDLGAPKGFSDSISVRSDGTVSASSPKAEHVDEMARPRESMRILPWRPPAN